MLIGRTNDRHGFEVILQNESYRDFLVTRLVFGKGFDFDEYMVLMGCGPFRQALVFDQKVAFASASNRTERTVGFEDLGKPEFKYDARYYVRAGCESALSYTIDAKVSFTIEKQSFTNIRVVLPNLDRKSVV